jgi:hypothetical protein
MVAMMKNLGTIVFAGGFVIAALALWSLSGGTWGRQEQYAITGRDQRQFGDPTHTPMLGLAPLKGEKRAPLAVTKEIYDAVRDNDQLHIRTRLIPLVGGELIQYSIMRAGSPAREWDEGWPFFGFSLFLGAFLGGGLLFALFSYLAAVFRLKAPTDV